jgi:hypothetical protein
MFEAALADVEDRLLSLVHHAVDAGLFVVGERGDLVRGVDHLAPDRVPLHDAPVGFRIK